MLSAHRTTWDVEDNWIALHGPKRTTWAVDDGWITFKGLGDPVDDVIKDSSSGNMKLRLASTLALANRAQTASTDKRGIPVMLARMADTEPAIRSVAAAALGIPGWVDAQVDPCLRNRIIATLQALADPAVERTVATRTAAAKTLKFLLELGMLDQAHLPIAEKCGVGSIFVPPPGPNVGPLVDPNAAGAVELSTGDKVAIASAATVFLGVIAYAVLGTRHPAQVRKRVKRR